MDDATTFAGKVEDLPSAESPQRVKILLQRSAFTPGITLPTFHSAASFTLT